MRYAAPLRLPAERSSMGPCCLQLPQREKEAGMKRRLGVVALLLVWGLVWVMLVGVAVDGVFDRAFVVVWAVLSVLLGKGLGDLSRRGVDKGSAGVLEKS